jgi:hypothetical protein
MQVKEISRQMSQPMSPYLQKTISGVDEGRWLDARLRSDCIVARRCAVCYTCSLQVNKKLGSGSV